jgi:hypothetical protein
MIASTTFAFALIVFWDTFLFTNTDEVNCIPGSACYFAENFTGPVTCDPCAYKTTDCDVSLGNATVLYCYQLVLDYGLAGGVAQGLFGLTILIVKITFWVLVSAAKRMSFIAVLLVQLFIIACLVIPSASLATFLIDINYTTFVKFYVGIATVLMSVCYPFGYWLELDKTTDQNMNRLLVNPNDDQDTNPLYGSVSSSS